MSSNQRTEVQRPDVPVRPRVAERLTRSAERRARAAARRRGPATWPLRTRLAAIMIALLAILGLVVGGTTEIFLHKTLYDQVDAKLTAAANPQFKPQRPDSSNGGYSGNTPGDNFGGGGQSPPNKPFPGSEEGDIGLTIKSTTDIDGGIVTLLPDTDGYANLTYMELPDATEAKLTRLSASSTPSNLKPVGLTLDGYGDYQVAAIKMPNGETRVYAISLTSTQETLRNVALVTTGAVVVALFIAGWAGAFIVRRDLKPLSRVAATASRVSELRLHRGEVNLAQRVPEADTDMRTEVGQVGAALNKMLDHVGNALEARHASEMQVRQFVADASHELRTPLAAIRGYAELSRRSRKPVPDEISHVLRRVESEATRMTALVEDLLLLARLDAGRPLAQDPVDLSMLVVDAVSDAHAAGPQHNWQLDLPDDPVAVIGDQQRLHQVLTNLLANARTHTPEGTYVCVAVNAVDDVAVIRVIDNGPGIPAELQPHIFKRFARGDSSRSRAAGSTGLGLSIVNAVVTAHGGQVSVQSQPGQTQFTVVLPLATPPAGRAPMSPHDYARIPQ